MEYKPEQFELEETTIWSFKERGNWATHKGDYRGNCSPQVPRNLKGIVPDNCIDFLFAHPPYANIIKYSKDIEQDISRLELREFLVKMKSFSKECFRILKNNISAKGLIIGNKIQIGISIC